MGKTLKFPKRKKHTLPTEDFKESKGESLSDEEHEERLRKLKELGLLK